MSKLPKSYTELEYIQSSGTQYVNTGYTPGANAKVIADFQVTQKLSNNNDVFGVVGQFSLRQYGASDFFRTVSGSAADFPTSVDILTRHTAVKTMTDCTIDGDASVTTTSTTVSYPLYLFAYNTGSSVTNYGYVRLYALKIYDGETAARDFVPCKNSSGAIGLYDTVGGHFYANAGTGTFTAGPEAPTEPNAPTRLTATVNLDIVSLSWTAAADATGYRISRDSTELADQSGTTYQDTVPETGRSYVYTVIAYNEVGDSNPATLTVTVPYAPSAPPAAPTGLTASVTLSTAQLTWTASDEADGYKVRRNGTQIAETANTQYLDTGLTRGQTYTYTVTAYNVRGEGAAASITATPELTFVTDRTLDDVMTGTDKGFYNATDLNRVGEAVQYIASKLTDYGYAITASPKTGWAESDTPTAGQMETYRLNIAHLRAVIAVLASTPETPESMRALDYVKANNIEQILADIDFILQHMPATFRHSGVTVCGSKGVIA